MLPYHHIPFLPPSGKKSAIPDDVSTVPFPARGIPTSKSPRSFGWRWRGTRALTLVEVAIASGILAMVIVGVLQGMLQSRRQTEGSIRQATCASLVQGYMEQIKSLKYATTLNDLPSSPSVTPGAGTVAAWQAYVGTPGTDDSDPTLVLKDSNQADTNPIICLAPGAAPTSLPDVSTLPTNAAKHTESVDIDNVNSGADNCTLDMWIWINNMTDAAKPNVVNCKSIVIVYQYSVKDGGRTRYYTDMTRQVRSIIPTDG